MTQVPEPGTQEHAALLTLVRHCLRTSENQLSSRHDQWRRSERMYRLYVDPDEVQEPREPITEEAQLLYPYPTSIVIPLSYSLIHTVISFWITLLTGDQTPIRIDPADTGSRGPARAQELVLKHQLDYIGWIPLLYSWLLDSCRYGLGIVKNGWDTIYRNQTTRRFLDFPGLDGPIRIQIKEKKQVLEYEGNMPEVIDPFAWRPDTRWPVGQFQRGSYAGECLYRSYHELMRRENEGIYQHIDKIKTTSEEHFRDNQSDRDRIIEVNKYFNLDREHNDGLVMVEEIARDLIPADYGLSQSTDLERWILTVANRAIIIRADEYPYDHNDFPFAIIESSPDFHSLLNPGLLEIMEPVHSHITWFVNSMLENARKSLNDRLVVDPSIVNMDDVLNPSAGKAIRLNESYWGIPGRVDKSSKQRDVQDISSQNFKHVGFLIDMLNHISAASETIQGQVEDEQRSATEISGAAQQGANRLRIMARLFAAHGLTPLARQMVQNNMQLLSQEQYIHIVGALEQDFQGIGRAAQGGGLMISPEDIQGLFSFPVSDASAPLDPVRFARTWVQIMQVSLSNPMMAQSINMPEVWKEMIRAMGVRDAARFLLPQQMQVMPDQQLQQQVQAGNLIPAPGQQPQNGATRPSIPQSPQPQSIRGEERRPFNGVPQ